ncbi:MAG: hypothetical protein ACTTIC_07635 [Helicobacteraceae bacterium]
MAYQIALIIHLFAAVLFTGFVFADVFVISVLAKKYPLEKAKEIRQTIGHRARKIYPLTFLVLFTSGGFLLSSYVNSRVGYFATCTQRLLMAKFFLATLIGTGILYSFTMSALKKPTPLFMAHFHKFALALAVVIILLAKLAFIV